MRIVVLDPIEMSDEQKERLLSLGTVTIYNDMPKSSEEIIQRAQNAEILVTGWSLINCKVLKSLKQLKYISLWATGYDQIDLKVATKLGIMVSNVRGYAQNAVAELAMGLMLSVARNIPRADKDVRDTEKYNWKKFSGIELSRKTLGVIGVGTIGSRTAHIGSGFEMKVLAFDPYPDIEMTKEQQIDYCSLGEVLKNSDVISIHLPLMPTTKKLMNAKTFSMMKKNAIVINTARAEIIDQDALVHALESGDIAGAGLDDIVIDSESGQKLMKMENVVLTPHMGFYTREAIVVKTNQCIHNIAAYIAGRPENVLNRQ